MFYQSNNCVVAVLPMITLLASIAQLVTAHGVKQMHWHGPNVSEGVLEGTKCPATRKEQNLPCLLPTTLFTILQQSLCYGLNVCVLAPLKMKVLEGTAFGKQRELDEVMREEHLFPLSFSLCEDTRSELLESYKMSLTRKRPCWTMNSNFQPPQL